MHALIYLSPTRLSVIPQEVFVPVVRYILFPYKVIAFPAQKDSTAMFNCSPGLATSQRLRLDTWRWCTISSPLLFLSAFLPVTEVSH